MELNSADSCCGEKKERLLSTNLARESSCCSRDGNDCCDSNNTSSEATTKNFCQAKNQQNVVTPTTRCIGVVSAADDSVITIFDTDGNSKHYQCASSSIADICFHNHGMDGSLLTPCIDDTGRHDDEGDCFCGEDAPHWHAHLKSMCGSPDRLAHTILYQVDKDVAKYSIPISPAMPGVCSLSKPPHPPPMGHVKHRIFPQSMQHGDKHVDDLVLNEMTGELHLGNKDCQVCEICLHGKFQTLGSRTLEFGVFSIYTIPKEIVENVSEIVRSAVYCGGICCAAEIPAVRGSLESISGVQTFHVNVALKQVTIDHNPEIVSAQDLLQLLASVGATTVLKDGGAMKQIESANVQSKFSSKQRISDIHNKCPLIQSFAYDEAAGILTATYSPLAITASQIAKQLEVTVVYDGTKDLLKTIDDSELDQASKKRFPRPTVIVSGLLWIVSLLSLIGGVWSHLKWVALVSIAFGIPPIAWKAYLSLRRWRFDTNCLMFFASLGAVGLQDFTEAAAVVFLFALSEWLELRATARARTALLSIIQSRPNVAVVMVEGELVTVPAAMVPVGTLVSVKAGDEVPCDGIVEEGNSLVDESSLTGESRPISKIPGSPVAGGTLNCGVSPLTVKTTATADNSAVSRLICLVEEAQGNRSTTEKSVDRFAAVYTPIVVFAALVMCTIPWFFGVGRQWTRNGLVLLVVACPCALIISTPVSYVAGLAASAARGLLIKGGAHLEIMAAVRRICFDKTGTLTNGKFALLDMEILDERLTRKEVFQYLLAMEEKASHPVAQAIVAAAESEGVDKNESLSLSQHTILDGEGVQGLVNGQKVFVGNERLFRRLNYSIPPSDEASTGFMGIEGHGVICRFTAADSIRPEAAQVIASLKLLGIESVMLTGDNEAAAQTVGKVVGLDCGSIKAGLLPEDKYNLIQKMVEDPMKKSCYHTGCLMMVGDGVNDAPALAIADVGVAMGEGAALSMETADITLLDSDLRKLEFGIRMGRSVKRKIVQNVVFSIVVKAVVLVFALLGRAELWAAIAADVGAMLVVTLNAMTLLPRNITPADQVQEGTHEKKKY